MCGPVRHVFLEERGSLLLEALNGKGYLPKLLFRMVYLLA